MVSTVCIFAVNIKNQFFHKQRFHVYSFSKAAITKYHKRSALNNTDSLSHSSVGYKFEIKVSAALTLFFLRAVRIFSMPLP